MTLEEARRKAYERGVEMKPAAGADVEGMFDQVDVGDIVYEALAVLHPAGSMPSARTNRLEHEKWLKEEENVRTAIWEAFDAGTRGKALKGAALPVPV